jgi:predicted AlkP superfamily phosphohydrolase/phosphomutase
MKFAIIGLDGADLDLIQQWDMPNLKKIMKNGSYGKYRSTLPPITAPAWSSIITGKDPSWHGVMHFVDTDPFFGTKQVVSSRSIKCKKIWKILNENNLSCGIYMVPMTYPVEKIDGFMVSGILTPGDRAQTFPDINISIKPFINWQHYADTKKFMDDLVINTEHKFKLLRHLIRRFNVDFLFAVDSNTDSIQHRLFYGNGLTNDRVEAVGNFFNFVDEKIGELLEMIDCPVLFVSDHGFGKYPTTYVFGNTWLRDRGFLQFKDGKIDWDHSKTYFYRAWINVGFIKNNVDDVLDQLMMEHWVDEVFLSKDIYNGPYAKNAPDIIFTFKDEFTGNEKTGFSELYGGIPLQLRFTGHKMDGFWACSEKINLKNLTDVAPTVLNFLNLDNAIKELGSPVDYLPDGIFEKLGKF